MKEGTKGERDRRRKDPVQALVINPPSETETMNLGFDVAQSL
jgi:hypothetical protein